MQPDSGGIFQHIKHYGLLIHSGRPLSPPGLSLATFPTEFPLCLIRYETPQCNDPPLSPRSGDPLLSELNICLCFKLAASFSSCPNFYSKYATSFVCFNICECPRVHYFILLQSYFLLFLLHVVNKTSNLSLCLFPVRLCSPSRRGSRATAAPRLSTPTTPPPSPTPPPAPWWPQCRRRTTCWVRPHPQVMTTQPNNSQLPVCSMHLTFTLCLSGQLYLMMSPQEVLAGSNQRTIAPRTQPYIAYVACCFCW